MEFFKKGYGLINSKAQPPHLIGVSGDGVYSAAGYPIRVVKPTDIKIFDTKEEAEKFGNGYDERLEVVEVSITVKLTKL